MVHSVEDIRKAKDFPDAPAFVYNCYAFEFNFKVFRMILISEVNGGFTSYLSCI